ncbi:hypothetical protein GCM10028833_31030 [Glycomyces tarimensis]
MYSTSWVGASLWYSGETSGSAAGSAEAGPATVVSPAITIGTVAAANVILAPDLARVFARLPERWGDEDPIR